MSSTARRELAIIGAGTLAMFIGANLMDTTPLLVWLLENQHSPLDEAILATLVSTVGMGAFSFRRWREVQAEIRQRGVAESELAAANDRLRTMIEEIQQQRRGSELIAGMADLLQSCLNVQEASEVIARTIPQLVPESPGALYLFNASRNLIDCVARWGEAEIEHTFPPTDCWALRRGRLYSVCDDVSPRCAHVPKAQTHPYQCVPLVAHGETIGILHLVAAASSATANDGQIVAVGEHTALAIANLRLRETLRNQSIRDVLTGLFNRRYLEETLERELQSALRREQSVACAVIDLDHFKRFNDTFGHEAGDLVLRELGSVMKAHVRASDIACRLGGEEFALIFPGATLDVALRRTEQVREQIRQRSINYRGEPLGVVTLSVGISVFPEHGTTVESLLRAADAALYRAKAEGRDRVISAESSSASPPDAAERRGLRIASAGS